MAESPQIEPLLFLGIFCRREDVAIRTLMRQTSAKLLVAPLIMTKFVICHPRKSGSDVLLWAELQHHDDLYLIDCVENMNDGKTPTYLASVRQDFPTYAYYGKMDTDSYVLYHNLIFALALAPSCRFYAGRSNYPLHSADTRFMSGSLYILSADLVEHFESCGPSCSGMSKNEDLLVGELVKSFFQDDFYFADMGRNTSVLYHLDDEQTEIHPWTVYVHDLKTEDSGGPTALPTYNVSQQLCPHTAPRCEGLDTLSQDLGWTSLAT